MEDQPKPPLWHIGLKVLGFFVTSGISPLHVTNMSVERVFWESAGGREGERSRKRRGGGARGRGTAEWGVSVEAERRPSQEALTLLLFKSTSPRRPECTFTSQLAFVGLKAFGYS